MRAKESRKINFNYQGENMPRVTFIYPCIGRFPDTKYVRSWQMQPLSIAILAGLTPKRWKKRFYDDRLEEINFDEPTDLVAISIETYTSKRGYEIAAEFRKRGVKVIMGGYHATFCKEEVIEHADAVCIGQAEGVWENVLQDTEDGQLQPFYMSDKGADLTRARPDRSIFEGKNYLKIALVEAGRGCKFKCNFCSITSFYHAKYQRRPVEDIIDEIKQLDEKMIFFVDDNVIGDVDEAKELFRALKPLGIQWISQASLNLTRDPELLNLMVDSGCLGLLIGFESLSPDNLNTVKKKVNRTVDYSESLAALRKRGIIIYGTFLFGLPNDDHELIEKTIRFAQEEKLFLVAFNHVVPFPGTPMYQEYEEAGKLIWKKWWLSDDFRFGQAPFTPHSMTSKRLQEYCHAARKRFYSLRSIAYRSTDYSGNCSNFFKSKTFLGLNLLLRKEVNQKRGLPLGVRTTGTERNPVFF